MTSPVRAQWEAQQRAELMGRTSPVGCLAVITPDAPVVDAAASLVRLAGQAETPR
jgi:hypothetical protein